MKLKGIVFSGIIPFIISIIAVGCVKNYIGEGLGDKGKDADSISYFVDNGILRFYNLSSVEEFINRKEKYKSFISFADLENIALDELDKLNSNREIKKWLEKYSNLFYIKKISDTDYIVLSKIDDPFWANIVNENGKVIIGNTLYYINRNKVYISSLYNEKFILDTLNKECKYCHNTITDIKVISKRKIKLSNYLTTLVMQLDNGMWNSVIYYNILIKTYKKIGVFWVNYRTTIYYRDIYGKFSYNKGNNYFVYSIPNNYYENRRKIWIQNKAVYLYTSNKKQAINFVKNVCYKRVHSRATSQGMHGIWAEIDF